MKFINIKNLLLGAAVTTATFGLTSCNDLLDMKPINQITPEAYYQNAEQLAAYLNNYYDSYLEMPFSGSMSHSWGQWNEGKAKSDWDTDIYCWGGVAHNALLTNTGKYLLEKSFRAITMEHVYTTTLLIPYKSKLVTVHCQIQRK